MAELPQANLLGNETSPYLLQHKDNPVHWRPWGPAALAEAERLNKPILLSIGYSSCHWCHVMAKESFSDPETAALMNELFVNIKVDREERPDVDAIHQAAVQVMGVPSGWPLTLFLTPKAEPFMGGTYLPKEEGFGRPPFKKAMRDVIDVFNANKEQVEKNVQAVTQTLTRLWRENRSAENAIGPATLEMASKRVCQQMDVFAGGLIGAPKFPNVPMIELQWRALVRTGQTQYRASVEMQLMNMCQGGIYDHLGGGFARYAVDENWMVPHFEKMLSDNALLIDILSLVWQDTGNPIYRARVEETVAWLLRDMITPEGAFAAALDADIQGEEGKHYTWSAAEIDKILGSQDAALFRGAYDIRDGGNWNNTNVLHRLRTMAPLQPVEEGRLNAMRQKLLAARNARQRPLTDNKVLADWNGLAIRGLVRAADAMNRLDWQAAAVRAFWFVADKMGDGGRLSHSWCAGKPGTPGLVEDYTYMARAAISLFEATGDARYLEKARSWVATLDELFWDTELGGYAMSPSDAQPLFMRVRHARDGSTPAANGMMIDALARLYFLTGEQSYRDRVNALVTAFAVDAVNNLSGHASYFVGVDSIFRAIQIVIIGDRNSQDTIALRDVLRRHGMPNKIVTIVQPGHAFPAGHPAVGKTQIQARATAYLCSGTQCSAPLADPAQLDAALRPRVLQPQQQARA